MLWQGLLLLDLESCLPADLSECLLDKTVAACWGSEACAFAEVCSALVNSAAACLALGVLVDAMETQHPTEQAPKLSLCHLKPWIASTDPGSRMRRLQ